MVKPSRFAALISGLFVFASTTVTGGFACRSHEGGKAMEGMDMGGMTTASPASVQLSSIGISPDDFHPERGGPLTGSPTDCKSMVSCTASSVIAERFLFEQETPIAVRVVISALLPPDSETKAPEPPPPRV